MEDPFKPHYTVKVKPVVGSIEWCRSVELRSEICPTRSLCHYCEEFVAWKLVEVVCK